MVTRAHAQPASSEQRLKGLGSKLPATPGSSTDSEVAQHLLVRQGRGRFVAPEFLPNRLDGALRYSIRNFWFDNVISISAPYV